MKMLINLIRRERGGMLATVCAWAITTVTLAGGTPATVQPPLATTPYAVSVAPYAGYVNHAYMAPPFRWGSFGAERHYPRVQWGRNYNGDVIRWSQQRRY